MVKLEVKLLLCYTFFLGNKRMVPLETGRLV
jgi:hypothetical protein